MAATHRDTVLVEEDTQECLWAMVDYAWLLRSRILTQSETAWSSFREGYRVGAEIGRRRYAAFPTRHPR
jgi:hypothetical protein